jgi:hypothetical protein
MSSNPGTPLSDRRGKKAKANTIVLANAPRTEEEQSGERRRPYFLKMLQQHIGTYILADTLDWDGESLFPRTPNTWRLHSVGPVAEEEI